MMLPVVVVAAAALVLLCVPTAVVQGLDCVVCGEYNDDGTGAITPCLNYSVALIPRLRKTCPRPEHKYCIKYVSELSVVRDCVEECREKEVWDTRTYCCNDGDVCNAVGRPTAPSAAVVGSIAICAVVISVAIGGGGDAEDMGRRRVQQLMF